MPKSPLSKEQLKEIGIKPITLTQISDNIGDEGKMIVSKVGGHMGDSLKTILREKCNDIKINGFCYWAQGDFRTKNGINRFVEPFMELMKESQANKKAEEQHFYVLMPISDNKNKNTLTNSTLYKYLSSTDDHDPNILMFDSKGLPMNDEMHCVTQTRGINKSACCFRLKKIMYLDGKLDKPQGDNSIYNAMSYYCTNQGNSTKFQDPKRLHSGNALKHQMTNAFVKVKEGCSLADVKVENSDEVNCFIGELDGELMMEELFYTV